MRTYKKKRKQKTYGLCECMCLEACALRTHKERVFPNSESDKRASYRSPVTPPPFTSIRTTIRCID